MKVSIQTKNGAAIVDLNRRKAVKHQCLNCSGWEYAGVRDCHSEDCPLWEYRTGKGKQDANARSKAIREYCLWCMNGQLMEVARCHIRTCALHPYRQTKVDMPVVVSENGHIEVSQGAI